MFVVVVPLGVLGKRYSLCCETKSVLMYGLKQTQER